MSEPMRLQLYLGSELGAEFEKYWNENLSGPAGLTEASARFVDERRSGSGLAMTLPAEVTLLAEHIATLLESEVARESIKLAGVGVGVGVVKFVWQVLIGFFQRTKTPSPKYVKIVIDGREITIQPAAMPDEPPPEFAALLNKTK